MPKFLTAWFEAVAAASPARRLFWLALLVLPIAALVAAYLWLHQPSYKVLYPKLSDRAGGEVMAALDKLDISYRVSEANGAIEVPVNQLYVARFKLAAQGLPKPESGGAEVLDNSPLFGLSQFQEQMRYQRALEAELVRSVEALSAVETARVHLALPKSSPFLRDPPSATAAVVVQIKSGTTLGNDQVYAIRRMVAASVPRLKAAEVSVLDQEGRLLGSADTPAEAQRAALEAGLARRVIDALAPWLGADKVKVQVTATLAGSRSEAIARVRNARPVEPSVRTPRLSENRLQRLNAAVILARDASPDEIEKATALARQALGIDPRRGDSVLVFALPPARQTGPVALPAQATEATPARMPVWIWPVGAGALLFIYAVWLVRKRRLRQAPSTPDRSMPEVEKLGADAFEALLQRSRNQTLDNPRVTADVIRLWMRA